MSRISAERLNEIMRSDALAIERALNKRFSPLNEYYDILLESMRYSACGGGKRVRPFLTIEFTKAYGGYLESALPFACAVECIHTYSLIHDDLPCMDNDTMRRGKPTNHVKFGEATALLAGDALQSEAYRFIAENASVSDDMKVKAVALLAELSGMKGMVGGQQIDLIGETEKLDYSTLLEMNRMKTGCLIRAASMLGCYAAGVKDTKAAEIYADNIGLCFQLTDDIIDSESEKDSKTTFLSFMTVEKAKNFASELTNKAIAAVSELPNHEVLTEFAEYLLNRVE